MLSWRLTFLEKRRMVAPPMGSSGRASAIPHTLTPSCALCGRSRYCKPKIAQAKSIQHGIAQAWSGFPRRSDSIRRCAAHCRVSHNRCIDPEWYEKNAVLPEAEKIP